MAARSPITRREALHLVGGIAVAAAIPTVAALASPAGLDPEWYVRECAACHVSVYAHTEDGKLAGVAEFYGDETHAQTERYHAALREYRADPDAMRKVGNFCIRAGRTYGT